MLVWVGLTACEPEVARLPVQAPEAVQELALVELQVSVELWPDEMEEGSADKETVGWLEGGGGGGGLLEGLMTWSFQALELRFQLPQVTLDSGRSVWQGGEAAKPVQLGSLPSVLPERNLVSRTSPPGLELVDPPKIPWLQPMNEPPSISRLLTAEEKITPPAP